MFEWNFIHHQGVSRACFDIDGVLCEDPTEEQNDDGKKYIDFIRHAQPKYIPTFEVGYLVSTRLEKYRKETEEWLKVNNVKYRQLIMLDLPNKEARIKQNAYGSFKGKIYKSLKDTDIFIESSLSQAKEIRDISEKFVFCTEISQSLPENWNISLKRAFERKIRGLVPKPVKAILRSLKPTIKRILHR